MLNLLCWYLLLIWKLETPAAVSNGDGDINTAGAAPREGCVRIMPA